MKQVVKFHIAPYFEISQKTFLGKLKLLVHAYLTILIIKLCFMLFLFVANNVGFTLIFEMLKSNSFKIIKEIYGHVGMLIMIVVVGPIVEECAFRGFLSTSKKFATAMVAISSFYIWEIVYSNLNLGYHVSIKFTILIAMVLVTWIIIKHWSAPITNWITKNLKKLMFISALIFASIHGFDFDVQSNLSSIISVVIVLTPYFLIALVLNFVRMRAGLPWSIALHMLSNAFILLY